MAQESPEKEQKYWEGRLRQAQANSDPEGIFIAMDNLGINPCDFDEVTQVLYEDGAILYSQRLAEEARRERRLAEAEQDADQNPRDNSPNGDLELSVQPAEQTGKLEQVIEPASNRDKPQLGRIEEKDETDLGLSDPQRVAESRARTASPNLRARAYATDVNPNNPDQRNPYYLHSSPKEYYLIVNREGVDESKLSFRERKVLKIGETLQGQSVPNSYVKKAGFLADCIVNGLVPSREGSDHTRKKREAIEKWEYYQRRHLRNLPAFEIERLFRQVYREADKAVAERTGA